MLRLARWHIWLGWLVAVPLILWTATGLWMVARPIEEVRGTNLRADAPPLALDAATVRLPVLDGRPLEKVELARRADRPVWLLRFADGDARAADALTGTMLPPVDAALARRISDAALAEPGEVAAVRAFAAGAPPLELRRERASWQVAYEGGLHVYVDRLTGELLAVRTSQWRLFDLAWGLHIMDLETREDTSHPILIGFAALSLVSILFGSVLMFRRRRARATGR